MNRRQFGGAAALAMTAALHSAWPLPSGATAAAPAGHMDSPIPEALCIPALAVSLGMGQLYAVERPAGRLLTVRFVAVEEDSRCPVSEGYQCFWAGQATVVVEIDMGGSGGPELVRFDWVGGSVFQVVWGHQGIRLFVVAADLSGDSATPPEEIVLDLILFPDWLERPHPA